MPKLNVDLAGCRILVVDDMPANLDVLIEVLEKEGFKISVATDGRNAINVAPEYKPDLVLLDVMMPDIDGYETCRRLKEMAGLEDTPVIFLTARDDLPGIVEGFESGGVDYVAKPFRREELLARIRTNLDRALLARELIQLNERLEDTVRERTEELRRRVGELEGKDRIAEHMLELRTLDETLAVVLEVVTGVVDIDDVVLHIVTDGRLASAAARGPTASTADSLDALPAWAAALATVRTKLTPARLADDGLAAQVHLDPKQWQDDLDEVIELDEEYEIDADDLR